MDRVRITVALNGTKENPFHRWGLRQNPFPQIARAELDEGDRRLRKLGGDPIPNADYIRETLAGFDPLSSSCAVGSSCPESMFASTSCLMPTRRAGRSGRMTIADQVERAVPHVRSRAEAMAQNAIGKRFSIRVDRSTVQHGTISKCEVGWVGQRGMSVVAHFRVTLENGGLHFGPFTVQRIPR